MADANSNLLESEGDEKAAMTAWPSLTEDDLVGGSGEEEAAPDPKEKSVD